MAQYEIKNSNNTMYPKVCGPELMVSTSFVKFSSDIDFSTGMYLIYFSTPGLFCILNNGIVGAFCVTGSGSVTNANYHSITDCVKVEDGHLFCKTPSTSTTQIRVLVIKLS